MARFMCNSHFPKKAVTPTLRNRQRESGIGHGCQRRSFHLLVTDLLGEREKYVRSFARSLSLSLPKGLFEGAQSCCRVSCQIGLISHHRNKHVRSRESFGLWVPSPKPLWAPYPAWPGPGPRWQRLRLPACSDAWATAYICICSV